MIYIYRNIILAITIMVILSGCKKYLVEENLGGRTAETYYNTASGFEDLVKSNYSPLRTTVNYSSLYALGTDIFSSYNTTDINFLNLYNASLNSALGDVDGYYKHLYYSINLANNGLYWSTQVQGLNPVTLNARIGELKTLRAYEYFLLTETFGAVPLILQRSTAPNYELTRTPEQDVYNQIIVDLNDAIAILPVSASDFGRVTKGMAQHLLSKVYLTRGYKSYGVSTDFSNAASLAEGIINSGTYALNMDFASLFDPTIANFQVNKEVIFSVQYSSTTQSNGAGNSLHQYFLWDTQSITPLGRSGLYGKPNYLAAPTPFFFGLFDKLRDRRYSATVHNALVAQVAGNFNGKAFSVGDTVIYYPDIAFTTAQKAARKYLVVNPSEYRNPVLSISRSYPEFKKFRELNLAYGDNQGIRDTYVFRLGETYLIAAEAFLKAGNSSKAIQYFNILRTRAAKAGINPLTGSSYSSEMQVTTLSIDDILDERARELVGEEFRWFELKRTGRLFPRVLLYNEEAKAANSSIDSHFLLRPIPQSQIDLNRIPFPQNTGY
ncbi:RagB/SusD family nutrient uptake outer membrane protein [Pedobacter frigidisoli]|uniref:RagB/SusD family nutrient uptake outer membrane protein n=1 Tax=Pedobacter frigidisoli TaxID=2530455 RepID=UPI00292CC2CE|nr:RagB/SusD family nutrient uptake outer membrane protein [Pedobacter frigidisoli]